MQVYAYVSHNKYGNNNVYPSVWSPKKSGLELVKDFFLLSYSNAITISYFLTLHPCVRPNLQVEDYLFYVMSNKEDSSNSGIEFLTKRGGRNSLEAIELGTSEASKVSKIVWRCSFFWRPIFPFCHEQEALTGSFFRIS